MDKARTILLVDDDPDVREFLEFSLEDAGYVVRAAANADEAMRALSGDPAIDLLITDVVMPGETGVALAQRAVALRPELQVLFITGYTRNIAPEDLARSTVLDKPFARERLLHAIERLRREAAADTGATC